MINYEEYSRIRDSKNMKDSDVARIGGFYQSVLSDWKKGISRPKMDKMEKIAEALGMDYRDFIGPVGKFSSYNPDRPTITPAAVDYVISESGNVVGSDPGIWTVVEIMKNDTKVHDQILSYAKFLTEQKKDEDDT